MDWNPADLLDGVVESMLARDPCVRGVCGDDAGLSGFHLCMELLLLWWWWLLLWLFTP